MIRCPNCGQKTSGGDCQWCNYPILQGREKQAEIAARERTKREAEEARKANEAQKQAKKEAEIAVREKTKREAEELEQMKRLEEYLKEIEDTREELAAGKIKTEEAIQKLRELSGRMPE